MNNYSDDEFLIRYNKVKEEHNNIKYAIVNNEYYPKEHPIHLGFYIIPGEKFNNYIVNEHGAIIQLVNFKTLKKDTILSNRTNEQGYYYNYLHYNGIKFKIQNHILVCLAFHGPKPTSDVIIEVNHNNGIKSSNHYSNLYWTTRQLNIKHAFDIGLNSGAHNNKSILVWDTEIDPNKENILEFKSIISGAIYFNIPIINRNNTFNGAILEDKFRLIKNKYVIKYKDDPREFPSLEEIYSNSAARPIYGFNIKTGQCISGVSIEHISRELNISNRPILNSLNTNLPYTYSNWLFSFNKDEDWGFLYRQYKDKYSDIAIKDLNTGQVVIGNRFRDISKYVDLHNSTIGECLKNKKYLSKSKNNEYLIFYLDDNSEELKELKIKYNFYK